MRDGGRNPKNPRLQLEPLEYQKLCQEVLKRDNWRCQNCGSMQQLQIHHKQFRSHAGHDSEDNLVTLCSDCHAKSHS